MGGGGGEPGPGPAGCRVRSKWLRAQALPSELERKATSGWSHLAGAADPERGSPARNLTHWETLNCKKLCERVGVSEPVEHGNGVCVCVLGWQCVAAARETGELRRHRFSARGGALCEGNRRLCAPEYEPGGAFRAPAVPAASCSVFFDAVFFDGKRGGRAEGARVSRGPGQACRLPSRSEYCPGVTLSKTSFPKLLPHSALGFPVGCHHSRAKEELGDFPEGLGENGRPRREGQKANRPPVPGAWRLGRATANPTSREAQLWEAGLVKGKEKGRKLE